MLRPVRKITCSSNDHDFGGDHNDDDDGAGDYDDNDDDDDATGEDAHLHRRCR